MRSILSRLAFLGVAVASVTALHAAPLLQDSVNLGRRQLGSVPLKGTTATGDYYTVIGGGNDIWDRSDECTFTYHELAGDFDIKVQVIEFEGTTDPDGCCPKAGIMVRENLAEDSKRVMMAVGGRLRNNNHEFLWRTGLQNASPPGGGEGRNGGIHSTGAGTPAYPTAWIRIVREGNVFTGYRSADGVNWEQQERVDSTGWQGGPMPGRLYVGLAAAPHYSNDGGATDTVTAIFTNYTETAQNFVVADVDSRGQNNKIFVTFNRPVDPASALSDANYNVSGGTGQLITGVVAGPAPNIVVLEMEDMTPNEGLAYTVQAVGVKDINNNDLMTGRDSGTFVHGKGYEARRIHIQHNIVQDGNSDYVLYWNAWRNSIGNWAIGRPPFEGNNVFSDPMPNEGGCPDDWGNNELTALYASRIIGVLAPTNTGDFTFAVANDDDMRLYLSPNQVLQNKQEIVFRACCIGAGNFGDTSGQSAPQHLVAGQWYALEGVYQEGCGGNYGQVAWNGDGIALANGKTPIEESFFVPSRFAHGYLFFNLGPAVITAQPQPVTLPVGGTANFSIGIDGAPPYTIQWRTNGVAVPGANGQSFQIANLGAEHNGLQISCCVSNIGGGDCSADALLTVQLNPKLLAATSQGNCHAIFMQFNKPMQLDGTYTVVANTDLGAGTTFYTEDFTTTNGGFTVNTPASYDGPWVYDAGAGSWTQAGQDAENSQANTSMLNSPAIAVAQAGVVKLTFAHRHSFEGGSWDGGQVRVSINGGAFTTVPAVAFTANGYNGTVVGNSASFLKGQAAFVETSADFATGPITSVCTLGGVNAGDTIQVQFIAASDTNTRGPNQPNWEVTSLSLAVVDPTVSPTTVTSVGYGATQNEIKLSVTPDLVLNALYYVRVSGAHSQDALVTDPDPLVAAVVHGAGYSPEFKIAYRRVDNVGNGNVNTWLASPQYANNFANERRYDFPNFETSWSDSGANKSEVVRGLWVVPASGTYYFWCSSDDSSVTYLAADGDPAHKALICREPEWANHREYYPGRGGTDTANRGNPPVNASLGIPLTAGQVVYLEGVWSEGGGGDHYALTYKMNDATAPANGTQGIPASEFRTSRLAPNGCFFSTFCDVFVRQHPVDQTVYLGRSATFTVEADGTPAQSACYFYQWYKNSNIIAGATARVLVTPPTVPADEGAFFHCEVRNDFSTNVSAVAQLLIRPNPQVLSVATKGDPNHVYVTWNKPVQAAGSYTLSTGVDTILVNSVAPGATPNEVVLDCETFAYGVTATLTIQDEMDTGSNFQEPNPTNIVVIQGVPLLDFNGPLPATARIYGNAALNADGSLHLTEAVNSQQGTLVVNLGKQVNAFRATYKLLMGDPTAGLADGSSFSFGSDVADAAFGEGGSGTGLIVRFNTYAGWFRGALVYWRGAEIARLALEPTSTPARFKTVDITMTASGVVTVKYDGAMVFENLQLPDFAPITGIAKIGIGARTGGENQKNWIDDLWFSDAEQGPVAVTMSPVDPTLPECSQITFSAVASGSPFYTYVWKSNGVAIAGATGATYTTPTLQSAASGAVYSVEAANSFSMAAASSTVTLLPDTNAPVVVSAGSFQGCAIGVRFDQKVDPATALNPLNYSINGQEPGVGIVPPIVLQPDGLTLIISNQPCLTGAFTLAVSNVLDLCPAINTQGQLVTGHVQTMTLTDIGVAGNPRPSGVAYGLGDDLLQVTVGGSDWWDTEDHAAFLYEERCGDFDMQVEVARLDRQSDWSKAGLAARISLAANSPMVSTYENPPNGANQVEAGMRTTFGGGIMDWQSVARPVASATKAIRLMRVQDRFIAMNTQDGTNWTIHADTGASLCGGVPTNLFVGLFATPNNGNNGNTTTAEFKSFVLSPQGTCAIDGCGEITIARDTNVVGNVVITWSAGPCCILQGATELTGPWTDIGGASPVSAPATDPYRFYRLIRRVLP